MTPERAKEIMESLGVIDVLHNGTSVWIQRVDQDRAEVQYLNNV
ncbi:MAG: small, acid-soluble spore protein, H family, partial [Chitinophagales bacterium]